MNNRTYTCMFPYQYHSISPPVYTHHMYARIHTYIHTYILIYILITVTVTVTVTVILFKCPKNKRPRGLPLDIRLSRLHLELPYMQNVLAHGTPPLSGVVAGSLISPCTRVHSFGFICFFESCETGVCAARASVSTFPIHKLFWCF